MAGHPVRREGQRKRL